MYEEDYQHDKRHGKGKLSFADGDIYEGDFQDNKIHGDAVLCTNCSTIIRKIAIFVCFHENPQKDGLFFVEYNVLQ